MNKIRNYPIIGLMVQISPYIATPKAVSPSVITQVQKTTFYTLIPDTLAKSISLATARINLPSLVFCQRK
jgi:hypothetical protein